MSKVKNKALHGLNPEQRKAVTTMEGPLLVLAGAGTGKTSVVTRRIAYMIAKGVPSRSILAMTFTNKAAQEMKERVSGLVSKTASKDLTIGTFHSFCVKSLRKHSNRVGLRKNFGICDAADQLVAMKQALRDLQIPETVMPSKVCLARVSLLKNRLVSAEQCLAHDDEREAAIGWVYQKYDQGLRASGLLDFDDLLLNMLKLLKDKQTCEQFRKRFRYLFVDEYQDTNHPQYEIVKQIGGKHRNVCVVGDDDQSIYGWRGADVSKILNFAKDFPKSTVVRLETNYRSTKEILDGANAVIRNNPARHEKALCSAVGPGHAIGVFKVPDEESEATFVVEDLLDRVRQDKLPLHEVAVLFRAVVQARIFEMQLRQKGIPYNLVGGMSFFDRKEVRDVLAYVKLVANPADELSLLRVINVPARGIGQKTIKNALAVAARERLPLNEVFLRGREFPELSAAAVESAARFLESLEAFRSMNSGSQLVELIKRVVRTVDYAAELRRCYPDEETQSTRWAAVNEIMNMAEMHVRGKRAATLTTFLEELTLNANEDSEITEEQKKEKITLMTLHAAKGLEFTQVYLVGAEEGLLPHAKSIQSADIEEERRLMYVGITRAKRRLTITYTRSRARYGERIVVIPSRFLYEMRGKKVPAEHLDMVDELIKTPEPGQDKPAKKKAARKRKRKTTARKKRPVRKSKK